MLRRHRLAPAALALVLTLVAGLFPFRFRIENRAYHAPGEGLVLRPPSMAITADAFRWDTSAGPARIDLELRLTPADAEQTDRDILVLLDESALPALRLVQAGTDLVIASRVTNPDGQRWYNDFRYLRALAGSRERHLTIAAGAPHPRVSLDGVPQRAVSGYGIPLVRPGLPARGRLLLGSDPRTLRFWSGTLRRLVVREGAAPNGTGADAGPRLLADYDFAAPEPGWLDDAAARAGPVLVPALVRPAEPTLLAVLPRSVLLTDRMLRDVAVNLLGLLPLGFVLARALDGPRLRGAAVPAALAVAACAVTSLLIETLQTLEPSRHSSALDLALNTLGGLFGAAAYVAVARRAAARADRRHT